MSASHGREGAGKRQRTAPLLRGEEDVARRERKAVRVANRLDDRKVDLEMEVADHPSQHLDLLRVLLPEERHVRAGDREELEADHRDPAEVAWPVLALEHRAELR